MGHRYLPQEQGVKVSQGHMLPHSPRLDPAAGQGAGGIPSPPVRGAAVPCPLLTGLLPRVARGVPRVVPLAVQVDRASSAHSPTRGWENVSLRLMSG